MRARLTSWLLEDWGLVYSGLFSKLRAVWGVKGACEGCFLGIPAVLHPPPKRLGLRSALMAWLTGPAPHHRGPEAYPLVPAACPALTLPSGSLDAMFALYKQLLPEMGGYLTHAGELNRGRLELFLSKLGEMEADVLQNRWLWGAGVLTGLV